MTMNGAIALTLRYFTEFGKPAFQHVPLVAQTCFTICAEYVPFDDISAATLQQD